MNQQYTIFPQMEAVFEQKLGKLVMEFAKIETNMGCAIGFLIPTEIDLAHAISAELSFKAKLALLSTLFLAKNKSKSALSQFEDWRKLAAQVEEKRNELVHSFYWPGFKDFNTDPHFVRHKVTAKIKKGLTFRFVENRPKDLDEVLQSIQRVMDDLGKVIRLHDKSYSNFFGRYYQSFSEKKAKK